MSRLLLASKLGDIIGRFSFVFPKPPAQLKVVCITTAGNVYASENRGWQADEMQGFRNMGVTLAEFDIAGKSEAEVADALADIDLVYVTGGNSYYLLEQMQKCDFKSAVSAALARGALYAGSSAGAVVCCPHIGFIGAMDDRSKSNLQDETGLGLIDFHILPHTDHPKYGPIIQDMLPALKKMPGRYVGLRDDQAVVVTDNYVELY